MSDDRHCDPESDCFKPPAIPTEVHCLHCHEEYDSYLIHWVEETDSKGRKRGFWRCPTPGCGGAGFGFDIFPTDPEWVGEDGEPLWCSDEGEDDEEDILEYIYCDDAPRFIDPWSQPTSDAEFFEDEEDPAPVFDLDDEMDDPFDLDDDDDDFDSGPDPVDPWQPPMRIDPAAQVGTSGRPDMHFDAPPHRIGPFYCDGAAPFDGVWEEDIPF